ncbi:MAG TPA: response regulator transcription factor [Thermoleophilaceae bacterium]|nr:response regulator transcription factor [Thermoleophilaceae bacterium]
MRVLLADDQLVTLEGVRIVLESSDDISVVGQAGTREELSSLVARTRPDVVLIDPQLCGEDDFACIDVIRANHREAKVVFFSMKSNIHHVQAALEAGAAAYIIKTIHPLDLVGALRQTLQRTVFHPRLSKTQQNGNGGTDELTAREREILTAVARGLSNKAIGEEFWVTEQTVKFHLSNVYRKLGVPSRTAAVRYAHEHGLVGMERERATA